MKNLRPLYILIAFFIFIFSSFESKASHIIGCEIHYQYLGHDSFEVTIKVYRNCYNPQADYDDPLFFGIYDSLGVLVTSLDIPFPGSDTLANNVNDPCLVVPPNVCVEVAVYKDTVWLPAVAGGYDLTWQRCCRNNTIRNIVNPDGTGASYTAHIPGDYLLLEHNSDPYFKNFPPTVICVDYPLNFDHSAIDPDGDSLVYSLCAPFNGADINDPAPDPPGPPPFALVTYKAPYTFQNPLGGSPPLNIDPVTGFMTCTPDVIGQFVVGVQVAEYRNGVLLSIHKRDFQFNVTECELKVNAASEPLINNCSNLTVNFPNKTEGGSIYHWTFGDGGVSDEEFPTHTYPDTGVYNVKLYVNPNSICSDSTDVVVRLYPKLEPKFTAPDSVCGGDLVQFLDQSTSQYGTINQWEWDFKDTTNHAFDKNPKHAFKWAGLYNVVLTVTNDIGCSDSAVRQIKVVNGPILDVLNDSICLLDTTMIAVVPNPTQNSVYQWSPNYMVLDPLNSISIRVHPEVTTTYTVVGTSLTNGCVSTNTLVVKVYTDVTATISSDTIICPGGTARLEATGGTRFAWFPPDKTSPDSSAVTFATPGVPSGSQLTYTMVTWVGKTKNNACIDSATVTVFVKPRPTFYISPFFNLCLGDSVQLLPSGGDVYTWTPTEGLSDPNIANPWASPKKDIKYFVTAVNTSGNFCPEEMHGSTSIHIITNNHEAFVGSNVNNKDTTIILGTGAVLHATPDNIGYEWYSVPPSTIDPVNGQNPLVTPLTGNTTYYVTYTFGDGCKATDTLVIFTVPEPVVHFPNAFAPDGYNKIFRPIRQGLVTIDVFRVFNRWGQMVFETHTLDAGWDGTFKGKPQPLGSYAYYYTGTATETGTKLEFKGNVTLVR